MLLSIYTILVFVTAAGYGNADPVICKNVVWMGHENDDHVWHCFNISDGSNWYGGGSRQETNWPLQNEDRILSQETTGARDGSTNSVHSRFWMSSSGLAIAVDDNVPLFVSANDFTTKGLLCFQAFSYKPYHYPENVPPKLSYTQCEMPPTNSTDLTHFYLSIRKNLFRLPADIPDESLFRLPFWSTYPKFYRPTTSNILNYATNISDFMKQMRSNYDSSGTLHIHDWELCEGELQFDSSKIPDPKILFTTLLLHDIRVALQIHPFLNQGCAGYEDAYRSGYLVTDPKTNLPVVGDWLGKKMYIIDFSNKNAVEWWSGKLKVLKATYGITSFVFEGGLSSTLTEDYHLSNDPSLQPDVFTTRFVEAAAALGRLGIVTSGWKTQHVPNFVRANRLFEISMSTLKSVIPNCLLIGLLGYPFIMPEIVGGTNSMEKPDKIAYIRWLQLSIFLPGLHMSFGPWDYDAEVMTIAKDLFTIRAKFEDYLIEVARQATVDGSPIIRPIWWSSPNDKEAQVINDQFLVGDKLLVAPITDISINTRDIYLPKGKWRDETNSQEYDGPYRFNHTVAINQLVYFTQA